MAYVSGCDEVFHGVRLADGKEVARFPAGGPTAASPALIGDLAWFGNAIGRLPAGNRWQARARAQLAGELRKLRQTLLQQGLGENQSAAAAARDVVDELKRNAPQDLAMLSAGLSEIRRLLAA